MSGSASIVVVGGGIVGLATARALRPLCRGTIAIVEAEPRLAAHQTGHNSGVIHSGLYYAPGSLKARNCVRGRDLLYTFCRERGLTHERCGKLVVAKDAAQIPRLDELERRGRTNGLEGLKRLSGEELAELEPHVRGRAGLWVPQTGIVDYAEVARAIAAELTEGGVAIHLGARLGRVERSGRELVLSCDGVELRTRHLINCAGLHSDRVARLCALDPGIAVVPFRGEYYELLPERRKLVRNLIYPVPDPRFPFLGVHLARTVHGGVEAGPNAVLALARHGYRWSQINLGDLAETFTFPGFWRMGARYWRTALAEVWRSCSKPAFVAALRELVPALESDDLEPAGAGVRAQAVDRRGRLLDDFTIHESEGALHVLNAPSPAATASLAIGEHLARRAAATFDL